HRVHCANCRAEAACFDGLASRLREPPAAEEDEVSLRRLRQRILYRVDAELSGRSLAPPRRRLSKRWLPYLFAVSVVAVAGTLFDVVVAHEHTQRVGVEEGTVTVRLAQFAPTVLGAGQTWERPKETTASTARPEAAELVPATPPSSASVAGSRDAPRALVPP